jgi:hypothetical protein
MKPTITKASDSFESVFQRLKLNQNYLSQWFLSEIPQLLKTLMDGVNSFCTREIFLILFIFRFAKSESRVSLPEVSNALHFTDWSKGISIFGSQRTKIKPDQSFQQNTNDRFSENILLLWFIWFFVKYKGRFCDSCCFTLIKNQSYLFYNEPKFNKK